MKIITKVLLALIENKIISNAALRKFGSARNMLRFICNEPFNLKVGLIPSNNSQFHCFGEEFLMPSVKVYSRAKEEIKSEAEVDVVEALIGAYLSSGGEVVALSFMKWLGMDIDFIDAP
ncbi:hypothetical protein MTR67_001475 [Solanum verrucosum]|uniref:RNase III domain-containing protein n=1 Tax=Solanum verrucosum TaxID=315347 RepID=A0AAF0PQN7_SOLVR|nr:hypothetical protein MTR67_001475 [Solanum verrucosum]